MDESNGQSAVFIDQDVVIVGAGPSGLALAIELGSRGIKCLVIERNNRVGYAPRAKTTNVRTRTHLRRWGIAERLAKASPFGVDYPSNVHFVTRLSGPSLAVIENASNCNPARNKDYPEHGQWVPQYKLEQVLREHAASLPNVTIRFNTKFISAIQGGLRVEVTLDDRNSNTPVLVTSRYLVGADGAHSAVRDLIGAKMTGTYGLSRNYNIVFRAPGLAQAHAHGPGSMYWQVHRSAPSLIGPMDSEDVWYFMPTRLPDGFTITQESAASLIRESTGIDLPYEILSSDEWIASSLIADRYREGRIFLIGDACHVHPPFGGYGMNMGIADGVDLGWKLSAVLQGWGGPQLLDSYIAERCVIHENVIAESAANHAVLSNDLWQDNIDAPGPTGDAVRKAIGERIVALKKSEFHTLGTVLGGRYLHSPIILDDAEPAPPHNSQRYVPSNRPGCLAPHVWRTDGLSLYDKLGIGFTLVCAPGAEARDIELARSDASVLGVPLAVVSLSPSEASDHYRSSFTLVRPDQYVAWRGHHWQKGLLRKVVGWDVPREPVEFPSDSSRVFAQSHGSKA